MSQGSSTFLCFQKVDVLVIRGAADVADPRQFRHIELSSLVGGIVAKEARRNIIGGHLRSADLLSLCFCLLHAGAYSHPNHRQFQLAEHTCHLQESLAHRVSLTVAANRSDTSHNHKPQALFTSKVTEITLLLNVVSQPDNLPCTSGLPSPYNAS